jgi:hypothetical protein
MEREWNDAIYQKNCGLSSMRKSSDTVVLVITTITFSFFLAALFLSSVNEMYKYYPAYERVRATSFGEKQWVMD